MKEIFFYFVLGKLGIQVFPRTFCSENCPQPEFTYISNFFILLTKKGNFRISITFNDN